MRRVVTFACEDDRLVGTVDEAPGDVGVLIVSGGNEVRCGAHRGMALLAQRLAGAGVPVFRFDRRGVGDSEGENRGYAESGPDIAAALATFRREQPRLTRVIGFGNCDAATALALVDDGCDALVLANPWLGDENAALPPAAVRAHYVRRLRNPVAWRRLLSGNILRGMKGVSAGFRKSSEQPLTQRIAAALSRRPTTIVLANGDRTAEVFAASIRVPPAVAVIRIDTASHSFAGHGDALAHSLLHVVAGLSDNRDS